MILSDEPDLPGRPGRARGYVLQYDKSLSASIEAVELTDPRFREDWRRERLFRLKLAASGVEGAVYRTVIQ